MTNDQLESIRTARQQLLDLGDEATAALLDWAVTAEPSGWRPIETAPKQGFVLLGNADEGWTEQARWDEGRREWWSVNTDWTDAHGGPLYPTHWQPLPQPPEA